MSDDCGEDRMNKALNCAVIAGLGLLLLCGVIVWHLVKWAFG
jgi:hypothetical protein